MKRIFLIALSVFTLFACKKTDAPASPNPEIDKRACATMEVLAAQMAQDPSIGQRMSQIERFTEEYVANPANARTSGASAIVIPVVVHVIYNQPEQNISDAQIKSQIDVLNEDYNLRNKERNSIPALFDPVKANVGVSFVLAQTIRKSTTVTSFTTNDAVKFSNRGGDDAIDPEHSLNMWVCNLGQSLLGYSTFPGQSSPSADGVVILYSSFGSRDKYKQGTYINKYDLGRTATHEVGHWLNLRHIWGDRTCGTDYVDDTPQATTANFNCPDYPHYNQCGNNLVEMTMNYMDYTQDMCMYMFSNGQKDRMQAVFAPGGPRANFR